jgi:hypothetical protein
MRPSIAQHLMPRIRALVVGIMLGPLAACFEFDLGITGLGDGGGCCGQPDAPVTYALSPDSAHVLLGDTTHFYTWQCQSGLCFDFEGMGNIQSEWTVTGGAVAILRGDGRTTESTSRTTRILVRAIALGSSNITSVASVYTMYSRTVRVSVADSSVISSVEVLSVFPMYDTVKVGFDFDMFAKLKDANGNVYTARPSSWSVGDSTVLRVGRATNPLGIRSRSIRGLKAGTADVVATFRGIEGRRRITIIP